MEQSKGGGRPRVSLDIRQSTFCHAKPITVIDHVPKASERQFDYIVCTTKNQPDCPPSLTELIAPAVQPGRTVIVLIQNGLNIEKPIFEAFPNNIVLSGVSMIGSHETEPGVIEHDDNDRVLIGPFHNPNLTAESEEAAARDFVRIYSAGGKTDCELQLDVNFARWRKLVYNACLNSICALTGLDTGRIRLADGAIDGLVRPAMEEIRAAAKAVGVELPPDVCDFMINIDPITMYLPPSMLGDMRKVCFLWANDRLKAKQKEQGNYTEFENIVGEPLRVGTALGVPMPTLKVLYHLLQAIQWRTKEVKGKVTIPPKDSFIAE
jgi:2-dehydropantoate 2-reductase